jgi:signal transduction histidine kinase
MLPVRRFLFSSFVTVFVFSLMLIVGLHSFFIYTTELKKAQTRLYRDADTIMNRLSFTLKGPWADADEDALETAMILEMAHEDVLAVVLKDKDGHLYMGKMKDEQWGISYYHPGDDTKRKLANSFINRSKNIVAQDRLIGTAELYISDRSVLRYQQRLQQHLLRQMLFVALAVILLLWVTLRKFVLQPLLSLRQAAEHFAHKNFSEKVIVNSDDEIGQLGDVLNRMADELHECLMQAEVQVRQIKEGAVDKEELLIDLRKHNRQLSAAIEQYQDAEKRWQEAQQSLERKLDQRQAELEKAQDRQLKDSERHQKVQAQLQAITAELDHYHTQLIHAEKLASIGQLSAGIAHEINNPLGFIGSNIYVFEKHIRHLSVLNKKVQDLLDVTMANDLEKIEGIYAELVEYTRKIDADYILEDMQKILGETKSGLDRIKHIVMNLRTFSRPAGDKMTELHMNDLIEGVLNIVWSEIKFKCELHRDYGDIPSVLGHTQKLGQVFINLFMNAAQSIEKKGRITVKTYATGSFVCVEVTDTGKGIEPDVLSKIFKPFFTTKDTKEGTGLGLSISAEIIHEHNGQIEVESEVGCGSTFIVSLPIMMPAEEK